MTPDEYAAQQALISAAVARYVAQFGSMFKQAALSTSEWMALLQLIFPTVQQARQQSAELARMFYDSQREQAHPGIARNERFLEDYQFQWFAQNVDPARQQMSQVDSPDHAVAQLSLRAVREVENAGRRQIIHAVENEPEPRIIRGWARVATGRETCSWCLMLVSRGPVYSEASTAGLDLDDETAQRMIAAGEDVSEFIDEWHTGCDCKVIPVFKQENWFGYDAYKRAEQLWIDATNEADRLIESGKSRTQNRNKEAQNALRRRLYAGDIDMTEFAGLAA
jgi:hypothetical protein